MVTPSKATVKLATLNLELKYLTTLQTTLIQVTTYPMLYQLKSIFQPIARVRGSNLLYGKKKKTKLRKPLDLVLMNKMILLLRCKDLTTFL